MVGGARRPSFPVNDDGPTIIERLRRELDRGGRSHAKAAPPSIGHHV